MHESLKTKELRKKLSASIITDQKLYSQGLLSNEPLPFNVKNALQLFEIIGSTYPLKTLSRRINLLTKKEQTQVYKIYKNIEDLIEKMDDIISHRAEKACDPWHPRHPQSILRGED